jgi:hypothetical protein
MIYILMIRSNVRKARCFKVTLMGLFKVQVSSKEKIRALLILNLINNILSQLLIVGYGFR